MEVTQRRPVGGSWQRWSSTRRGTLVIAAVSTLVAAVILVYAMNRYRSSVNTPAKSANVLVATRFIEKGTSGAAIGVGRYFKPEKLGEKQVSTGALADAAALHGQVTSVDIYPGQQLTAADFVGGGLFYSKLPPNLRAVSVPVDTAHGMIGNIQTGDRADVYVSFPAQGSREAFLRLLAANVVVLDAGQKTGGIGLGSSGLSNSTANVVLEVSVHESAELAFAADYGKVWLVLSPARGTSSGKQTVTELSILAENQAIPLGGHK